MPGQAQNALTRWVLAVGAKDKGTGLRLPFDAHVAASSCHMYIETGALPYCFSVRG